MRMSIRKFLLINLLLVITVTTILTAIGNYILDQKDIQEHLDSNMAISAMSYQALLGEDILNRPLTTIQRNLNTIPDKLQAYQAQLKSKRPAHFVNTFSYQVWTKDGHLLLHTPGSPGESLVSAKSGFSDAVIDKSRWRVFTTREQTDGIHTALAERYVSRNELVRRVTRDDLGLFLLIFPISALLIWVIIGRGLSCFRQIAQALSSRDPNHLAPMSIKDVPAEIKPVIDELNELFQRLQDAFAREQRFAADAAHELRTPLAALKTHAQVALKARTVKTKNEALVKLIDAVNRSTHVVQQLLILSRLASDNTHQITTQVNLNNVAQETLAMMAPTAVENQVELELDAGKKIPKFLGNSTAISILIRNLVDNAIRYGTAKHPHVIVRTYVEGESICLEVEDNGPGIPDDLTERVFERFFRALGHQKTGSGLGLAIVQDICKLHHATIALDKPKSNSGLIVRIMFPAVS